MTTSLYDLAIPPVTRGLRAMAGFLEKGRAWAEENGVDPAELLASRLFEDMAPLSSQVQRACDSAKFAVVRLGQVDNVVMEDVETSFADLQDRIARTLAFVESVDRAAIDGREEASVVLETPRGNFPFTGLSYAQGFTLPNFYFHVTTAYALLRHRGAPIGKLDFLGGI